MSRCIAPNQPGTIARPRSRRRLLAALAAGLPFAVIGKRFAVLAQDDAAGATPCPDTTPDVAIAVAEAYFDAFNTGDADEIRRTQVRERGQLYLTGIVAGLLDYVPVINLVTPAYAGLAFIHYGLEALRRERHAAKR